MSFPSWAARIRASMVLLLSTMLAISGLALTAQAAPNLEHGRLDVEHQMNQSFGGQFVIANEDVNGDPVDIGDPQDMWDGDPYTTPEGNPWGYAIPASFTPQLLGSVQPIPDPSCVADTVRIRITATFTNQGPAPGVWNIGSAQIVNRNIAGTENDQIVHTQGFGSSGSSYPIGAQVQLSLSYDAPLADIQDGAIDIALSIELNHDGPKAWRITDFDPTYDVLCDPVATAVTQTVSPHTATTLDLTGHVTTDLVDPDWSTLRLVDENDDPVTTLETSAGRYTVEPDGKVTFTPDPDFPGGPTPPVKYVVADQNGTSATSTIDLTVAEPDPGPAFTCDAGFYAVSGANFYRGNAATGVWSSITTNPGGVANALGYNPNDDYLYAVQGSNQHVLRIAADGTLTDLGTVTGLPTGSYNRGTFDENGTWWVAAGANTVYKVDLDTMTAQALALTGSPLIVSPDLGYYDGSLVGLSNRVIRVNPVTGAKTQSPVISGLPTSPGFSSNSLWTTHDGRLFAAYDNAPSGSPLAGIWEIVAPYGSSPTAVQRTTTPPTGSGDGANCYGADAPWGIVAGDDDFSATRVTSSAGGTVGSVFDNDRLLHTSDDVTAEGASANVTVTLTDDGGLDGATIGDDGTITIPAGTAAGTYELTYRICEKDVPASCDTATVTVTVLGEVVDDTATITPGGPAAVVDVLDNDGPEVPGVTLDPSSVVLRHPDATNGGKDLTVAGVGTWQVGTGGAVTFTPDPGYVGPTPTIEYGVTGDDGNMYVAGLTVTVMGALVGDTATVRFGEAATVDVLDNDGPGYPAGEGPEAGSLRLVDPATGEVVTDPATPVVVPGEGTWTVDPATGEVTFTPETGFIGTATPIDYRVEGTDGNTYGASVEVTVWGLATDDEATIDPGTTSVAIDVLDNDSAGGLDPTTVRLLDPSSGDPVTSVTTAEGTWTVDPASGEVTFAPAAGFTGVTPKIFYVVEGTDGTYIAGITVNVRGEAAPDTGRIGPGESAVTVDVLANDEDELPPGVDPDPSTVRLIDPDTGDQVTHLVTPEGTWTVEPDGRVTFVPGSTYVGTTPPVRYVVTGTDGVEYTAEVRIDVVGKVTPDRATGPHGKPIVIDPLKNDEVPGVELDPSTVRLIDPRTGDPVDELEIDGVGRWVVDPQTGQVTFTPEPGFSGTVPVVGYVVEGDDGNMYGSTIELTVKAKGATSGEPDGHALPDAGSDVPWPAPLAGLFLILAGGLLVRRRRQS